MIESRIDMGINVLTPGRGGEDQVAQFTTVFSNGLEVLIAKTQSNREIGPHFPIVLAEGSPVVSSEIALYLRQSPGAGVSQESFKDRRVIGQVKRSHKGVIPACSSDIVTVVLFPACLHAELMDP